MELEPGPTPPPRGPMPTPQPFHPEFETKAALAAGGLAQHEGALGAHGWEIASIGGADLDGEFWAVVGGAIGEIQEQLGNAGEVDLGSGIWATEVSVGDIGELLGGWGNTAPAQPLGRVPGEGGNPFNDLGDLLPPGPEPPPPPVPNPEPIEPPKPEPPPPKPEDPGGKPAA